MLARMGPDSMVRASVGGLAHLARMSREDCEKSLKILMSPDPDSRSSVKEGRRIERREGGFHIINGDYYRELQGREGRKAYMRDYMRKRREAEKLNVNTCKQNVKMLRQEEEEEEEESLSKETPTGAVRENTSFAEIPTWDEIWELAQMRGILRETAESFFNYHQDNDYWLNKFGKPINWKSKIQNWKVTNQTFKPNGQAPKRKKLNAHAELERMKNAD